MRKARIIISARTESRVERWIASSLGASASGSAAALARNLSPTAFSVAGQSPSSALIRSPLDATGQFGRSQEGPLAVFSTLAGSSPRASKKSRQPGSTEFGSRSYLACNAST